MFLSFSTKRQIAEKFTAFSKALLSSATARVQTNARDAQHRSRVFAQRDVQISSADCVDRHMHFGV